MIDERFFHEIVWRRFVRMPYGHVLDYAGKSGENLYPTKEECERSIPNPRSWGLPIENCAFFTGLYAYALIEKYAKTKSAETAKEVEILMRGLYLLQDVARVDGFIARGVGEDGESHYPMGAECQVFPWTLALFAYYKSELCRDREAIKARLLRTLLALRSYGWVIPCDMPNSFYKGSWSRAVGFRGNVMLVFCERVISELTGEEQDAEIFEKTVNEAPVGSVFTRAEIVSQGYANDMLTSFGNQTWICTYTHLALRELVALDPKRAGFYRRGLYNGGVTAVRNLASMKQYDNKSGGFDINWRALNDYYEGEFDGDANRGTAISDRVFAIWHEKFVPRRHMEHGILGNALFAAWVGATSGDERIQKRSAELLLEGAQSINWDEYHLSYAFVAEAALIAARRGVQL